MFLSLISLIFSTISSKSRFATPLTSAISLKVVFDFSCSLSNFCLIFFYLLFFFLLLLFPNIADPPPMGGIGDPPPIDGISYPPPFKAIFKKL